MKSEEILVLNRTHNMDEDWDALEAEMQSAWAQEQQQQLQHAQDVEDVAQHSIIPMNSEDMAMANEFLVSSPVFGAPQETPAPVRWRSPLHTTQKTATLSETRDHLAAAGRAAMEKYHSQLGLTSLSPAAPRAFRPSGYHDSNTVQMHHEHRWQNALHKRNRNRNRHK